MRFWRAEQVPSRRRRNDAIERQEAILALLGRFDEGLSLREIVVRMPLNTSERQVRRALAALRERSLAHSSGRGRAARWTRTRSVPT